MTCPSGFMDGLLEETASWLVGILAEIVEMVIKSPFSFRLLIAVPRLFIQSDLLMFWVGKGRSGPLGKCPPRLGKLGAELNSLFSCGRDCELRGSLLALSCTISRKK